MIKSPLVSIAWAGAAVTLPLLEGRGESSTASDWIIGIWLAGFLMPLLLADSLLLDIRDLEADRAFDLHTIAVRAGSRRVHLLVVSLIAVSVVLASLATTRIGTPPGWMNACLTAGIGLGLGWACWPWLRRREAAISISMMAWRFLLLIPVALG